MTTDSDDSAPAEHFIEVGAEVAGGVAASAIGFLGGGSAGAIVGAGSGPLLVRALRWAGQELGERFLSPRQQVRIGGAFAFAVDDIRLRLEQGEDLRNDGFFDKEVSPKRTPAEEILEGTLMAAERSYEERKLPYLGKLYSGIVFDSSIGPSTANYLIHLAETLTWTQYVLIRVIAQNFSGSLHLRETMFPPGEQQPPVIHLAHEMLDLAQRNFLLQKKPAQETSELILDAPHIGPQFLKIQGMAFTFFRLARLEDIPDEEWSPTARMLGSPIGSAG